MDHVIEEVDSDEIELQKSLAVAETQFIEKPFSPDDAGLHIEEIEFHDEASAGKSREKLVVPTSSGVSWKKSFAKDSIAKTDDRKSKANSSVFADLPKRLRDAESRYQSSRSMLSSLASSTLYNFRGLRLTVLGIHESCGSAYLEAFDDEDSYLVHLPRDTNISSIKPGAEVVIDGSFTRRKLHDHWLLSMVVSLTSIQGKT